ncbi:hypothetical protein [Streptomyces sp. NPDC053048]|uniref:hypothetical protein n=1 Tax=Streptomyces sp. NPDC053048 TaxID=3365694 RepID=UPI0037D45067
MKAIPKSVTAVTGIALALALAACGTGEEKTSGTGGDRGTERREGENSADKALKAADPLTTLKAAVVKGAQQNTYRTKGKRKSADGEFTSEGVYQVKPDAAEMKDFGPKTEDTPDGLSHIIKINDTMYGNTAAIPGKKWWTFDLGGAKAKEQAEPFVLMAAALATTGDLKSTGVETAGGRRAAHYQGTVVVSELSAYKGDAMKDKDRDAYVNRLKDQGLERITLGVWVDGNGLVARTEEKGKGSKGDYSTTDDYSGFGEPVTIKAPPASETAGKQESMEALAKKK